jgi:hypothetical protein
VLVVTRVVVPPVVVAVVVAVVVVTVSGRKEITEDGHGIPPIGMCLVSDTVPDVVWMAFWCK